MVFGGRATSAETGHMLWGIAKSGALPFFYAIALWTCCGILMPLIWWEVRCQQRRVVNANLWYGDALMSRPVRYSANDSLVDHCQNLLVRIIIVICFGEPTGVDSGAWYKPLCNQWLLPIVPCLYIVGIVSRIVQV